MKHSSATQLQIERYLDQVCSKIANREAHVPVRQELWGHIEAALESIDAKRDPEDAVNQVIAQMGCADVLGNQLDQTHRLKTEWPLIAYASALMFYGFVLTGLWNSSPYIAKHILWTALGVVVAGVVFFVDHRALARRPWRWIAPVGAFLGYASWQGKDFEQNPYVHIGSMGLITLNVLDVALFTSVLLTAVIATRKIRFKTPLLAVTVLGVSLYFLFNHSTAHSALFALVVLAMLGVAGFRFLEIAAIGIALAAVNGVFLETSQFLDPMTSREVMSLALSKGLPFPDTDFVWATAATHWGGAAALVLLLFSGLFVIRLIQQSSQVVDALGRTIATGFCALFIVEFGWHVLANLTFLPMPRAGIKMPFLSYGGTHTVLQLAALGFVLGIARYRLYRLEEVTSSR